MQRFAPIWPPCDKGELSGSDEGMDFFCSEAIFLDRELTRIITLDLFA